MSIDSLVAKNVHRKQAGRNGNKKKVSGLIVKLASRAGPQTRKRPCQKPTNTETANRIHMQTSTTAPARKA